MYRHYPKVVEINLAVPIQITRDNSLTRRSAKYDLLASLVPP